MQKEILKYIEEFEKEIRDKREIPTIKALKERLEFELDIISQVNQDKI
jgi:phage terminase small subunit